MAIAELKNGKQVPLLGKGETERVLYALTTLQQTALRDEVMVVRVLGDSGIELWPCVRS